jgi:hypothetical protein
MDSTKEGRLKNEEMVGQENVIEKVKALLKLFDWQDIPSNEIRYPSWYAGKQCITLALAAAEERDYITVRKEISTIKSLIMDDLCIALEIKEEDEDKRLLAIIQSISRVRAEKSADAEKQKDAKVLQQLYEALSESISYLASYTPDVLQNSDTKAEAMSKNGDNPETNAIGFSRVPNFFGEQPTQTDITERAARHGAEGHAVTEEQHYLVTEKVKEESKLDAIANELRNNISRKTLELDEAITILVTFKPQNREDAEIINSVITEWDRYRERVLVEGHEDKGKIRDLSDTIVYRHATAKNVSPELKEALNRANRVIAQYLLSLPEVPEEAKHEGDKQGKKPRISRLSRFIRGR